MSEDLTYLLLCYLMFGLTLTLLIYRSRNRRRTLLTHATVALIYSAFLLYNLKTNSSGGAGLVWLVFLLCALLAHSIMNVLQVVWTYRKR
jgi:peptidoglycan/LPS O-acetylase OafA/YrhL